MKRITQMAVALASVLGLWLVLTWPLPRFAAEGIPFSAHAPPSEQPRAMVPGDHLQLLYHFWLVGDMLSGSTPWMYNLYEFNTGDDTERHRPGAYFAPFSWAYAAAACVGGRAVGWHAATLLSLLIAFAANWHLARRYSSSESVAWAVAIMALAFPYRWLNLLGGSPTGFGMAWTPVLMLGLDRAIRDGSWRGGALAGLAMLFSGLAEKHAMFFNALLIPAWAALVFAGERPWKHDSFMPTLRRALAALPVGIGLLLAYLYATLYTSHLGASAMAQGRRLAETKAFSPQRHGFWDRHLTDISSQLFPGWVLPAVLILALAAGFYAARSRSSEARRHVWVFGGLLCLGTLVLLLAPGPNGHSLGRDLFDSARALLPPYRMIRQSAKIMLLFPALLVPLLAIGIDALPKRKAWALALAFFVLLDVALWTRPSICLLDQDNGAYAAVAEAARRENEVPRALVIPLWPGDSHYASVYQHYASMHHLRLANGYSPVVSRRYIDDFFALHQPANQGILGAEQVEDLSGRGIHYLLLHEDLFPEKVSPFPVGVTLDRLLTHPRLRFLGRDGAVWAFRLLQEDAASSPDRVPAAFLPTRLWEAEAAHRRGGERFEDAGASGGLAVRLKTMEDKVEVALPRFAVAEGPAWWVRLRGTGELHYASYAGTNPPRVSSLPLALSEWTWISVSGAPGTGYGEAGLALRGKGGLLEVDRFLLGDASWARSTPPGWSLRMPASSLFHAGATAGEGNLSVFFHPRSDPARTILYGPRMPISPGLYEIELEFAASSPLGTTMGRLMAGKGENSPGLASCAVRAGESARLRWTQDAHDLLWIGFSYSRAADMEVQALRITRVDTP